MARSPSHLCAMGRCGWVESPVSDRLRNRWTWQSQGPRRRARITLTQMMRLSHSGSSGCGSDCGSSMVRGPRRRAPSASDGRASQPGPASTTCAPATGARPPGPAPAPLTRAKPHAADVAARPPPRPPRPSRATAPEPAPPADRSPRAE